MLVDLSVENMTLDQCLTRVKNTGFRVAALIHQTVDYRLPMRWWATETVKSPQLSLNTMAYYCILCYIFFPGLFFILFSFFAHLWWFGDGNCCLRPSQCLRLLCKPEIRLRSCQNLENSF